MKVWFKHLTLMLFSLLNERQAVAKPVILRTNPQIEAHREVLKFLNGITPNTYFPRKNNTKILPYEIDYVTLLCKKNNIRNSIQNLQKK